MPRGRKSKLRAREKRQQARIEAQRLQDAQATAAQVEESASSPSPPFGGNLQSSPTSGSGSKSRGAWRALSAPTASAGASCPRSHEHAGSQDEERPSTSQAAPSTESSRRSPLDQKAHLLVHFMLRKYNRKEPITKDGMMKQVIKKHRHHFHEILRKASDLMVLAFGIGIKEVDPARHRYVLVNKLHRTGDERLSGEIMPNRGLLMTVLCVIFMKGNCATEEEIWEVLNEMGIHAGEDHFVHGEPKKLITEDLVKEGFLEYRQVRGSDPPRYEFLWGPRAHAETSKMEILEFLAKLHDTEPSAMPLWYEEALKDQQDRARMRFAALVITAIQASLLSMVNVNSFSHMY